MAFISSRTTASTLRITRKPIGSQVYRPEASLRIMLKTQHELMVDDHCVGRGFFLGGEQILTGAHG